jgi:hypothetical protein
MHIVNKNLKKSPGKNFTSLGGGIGWTAMLLK